MKTKKLTIHKVAQIQRALDARLYLRHPLLAAKMVEAHYNSARRIVGRDIALRGCWSYLVQLNLHTA